MIAASSDDADKPLLLVVEDEFFIAFDLCERLSCAGYGVLGPAGTVREAHRLLNRATPRAALLDMNVRGELVTPVAERLRRSDIPYILTTAYCRCSADPPALADAPRLMKPISDASLLEALNRLLK